VSTGEPVARRRAAAALLFVLLFTASQGLVWAAYYAWGTKALIGDEQTYLATAQAIRAGGAWMPGSIWPPLQPLLLALLDAATGAAIPALQLLQGLLFVACGALLRDLWRRLGGSVAAANTAAALFLLNPATAAYAQWLWPEMPHLFLLLAVLDLLARAATPLRALAAGACAGLALLAKSLLSPFWPAFLLLFARRPPPFVAWRPALLFVLALGLLTGPALLHGWHAWGRPMIADSSVYNLWIGLTDRWRSDYVQDLGGRTLPAFLASGATPQERNAVYLGKLREHVATAGVPALLAGQLGRQYFRLFSAKTPLQSQLPGAACAGHLSVYRVPAWMARLLAWSGGLWHALTLVAAAFGLCCWRWDWRRRDERAAVAAAAPHGADAGAPPRVALQAVVALFLAYQLLLFLLIHVKARFLLPMLPFLCGFGGSFLVACVRRQPSPRVSCSPPRLVAGALLALLLLFLAFGGPLLDRSCG
jgi:hypothetical protein